MGWVIGFWPHSKQQGDLQTLLGDLGFERVRWEDKTDISVGFVHSVLERVQTQGWMPLRQVVSSPAQRGPNT